ncbi:MAG: calcium-binding protein [Solirubrobacterales bacterium]|nr:calcium-binding protein [Solirubrobacterales bacterium]MCB8915599.1 calcium-binding protein [Thermoleophilales bacterium]
MITERLPARSNPLPSLTTAVTAVVLLMLVGFTGRAEAVPSQCFGKPINRVITGDHKTVHLKFRDVTWVAGDHVTVIGKPFSHICAGDGKQTIYTGKGITFTDAGPGNDRIFAAKGDATVYGGSGNDLIRTEKGNKLRVFGGSGNDNIRTGRGNSVKVDAGPGNDKVVLNSKTTRGVIEGGLGNDYLRGSRSHDRIYAGPRKNPRGLPDRDKVYGVGGNDRIYDYSGTGNRLYGLTGSDRIYSLGNAVSEIHGGNGTDFLYSNGGITGGGVREKLFGEQGNDRLKANQPRNNGPAYLDGGEGDDWVFGTPRGDTIITHSGIKKLYGNGGDDLFVTTGRGLARINGGPGSDTISYAAHTPPGGRRIDGVIIDLRAGTSLGTTRYRLASLENVIGSAFDDEITADPGVVNHIEGGLGDDVITGNSGDGDIVDGGIGENECSGFDNTIRCNRDSPGNFGNRLALVDISAGGIPVVMGGTRDDRISVGYDASGQQFRVQVADGGVPSGDCRGVDQSQNSLVATTILCPADRNNLDGMLVYGGDGADQITLQGSIPRNMSTTLNGGSGKNRIQGGPGKDFISTSFDSAGSELLGGGNNDLIYVNDRVTVRGGKGTDHAHILRPCSGSYVSGGPGNDSTVYAGSPRGVKADLGTGYVEWLNGPCAARTRLAPDIERLEGSPYSDWLILGRRHRQQQGRSSILGREGRNILDSKNGRRDTVTTGPAAHANRVIRDRKDKVVWGWGLAAF